MSSTLTIRVPAQAPRQRLDRFLAAAQKDLSRSQLQALIRDGQVLVNGRPARASQSVRERDLVRVQLPAPREVRLEAEAIPLAIVHEDADLLIVDKPAGMVVHPGAGVAAGTLVHALLHLDPRIAGVGGAGRPGIVHRLDRDTSGLLAVARTPRAYRALIEAMRARAVTRVYRALVWGTPRGGRGTIEGPIGRDPRHRQRMAVVRRGGKPARTHWRVTQSLGPMSLVEARLDTGRTHQIRVHFAHLGHPVVGDPVYGGRTKKLLSVPPAQRSLAAAVLDLVARQALHAAVLELAHPVSGQPMHFDSPLPADLAGALQLLGADHPRD
jgi:23S rRNA pseudouridine1911/1915/1917 synthase